MANYNNPRNVATIVGEVAKIETKTVGENNLTVATLTLKAGNGNNGFTFVAAEAFGKTAELLAQYAPVGTGIAVFGQVKTDSWTDKEGAKRSKTLVNVSDMALLKKAETEGDTAKFNAVTLIGRLCADPVIRQTPSGKAVANVALAVSNGRKGDEEKTEFVTVVAWEDLTGLLGTKGDTVLVNGALLTDSYEKDGQKMFRTYVNAATVVPVYKAGAQAPAAPAPAPEKPAAKPAAKTEEPATKKVEPAADDYADDELPF